MSNTSCAQVPFTPVDPWYNEHLARWILSMVSREKRNSQLKAQSILLLKQSKKTDHAGIKCFPKST